jgi:hypothetical protein
MGYPVLILGETGSGKTYSLKNFSEDEVGIFSVEKPYLPFKKKFKVAKNATYEVIASAFKDPKLKAYVIDDSQYLLVNEMFDKAKDSGYGKFTDIALHFRNLIHYINASLPDALNAAPLHLGKGVYAAHHHTAHTFLYNKVGTGWRLAIVRAGFQAHVHRGLTQ